MEITPIIIVVFIAALIFFFIKLRKQVPKPDTDSTRPPQHSLPKTLKENDKLVYITGVTYSDLKAAISGFCNMYNNERFVALPRLFRLSESRFAITFPYDVDFATYCYFINYMYYPMEVTWNAVITGWATMKSTDEWVTEKGMNKMVMLFVPDDDTEHDNVYMTTSGNIGYKLGFSIGQEKKLLERPKKNFIPAPVEHAELANTEFDDFT